MKLNKTVFLDLQFCGLYDTATGKLFVLGSHTRRSTDTLYTCSYEINILHVLTVGINVGHSYDTFLIGRRDPPVRQSVRFPRQYPGIVKSNVLCCTQK